MSENIIDIHMIDNRGFIFNANDWLVLRKTHRLMGSLIGSLPNTPRRVDQNGLPSMLLPEEVRLLVENGIGRAVQYPSFTSLPSEHIEMLKHIQEQNVFNEKKKELAIKKADHIGKMVIKAVLADGDENCDEVIQLNREVRKIRPFNPSMFTTIHLDEPCSEIVEVPLPKLVTNVERIRYKAFKDLWSKGFYLTCGLKFGGDFLVYEGDPIRYHAKYIVNCTDAEEVMTSLSRVATITKKKMVLAKDDGDSVKYIICHTNDKLRHGSNKNKKHRRCSNKRPIRYLL